ncbi:SDR family oxidoreductase [Pandoraea sp. ISTKB]|uniref:SDR family oxidoreductase n=1 Tax=Pandoraea sp. ISTKB TaxID=1586708 RepID=UPI000847B811|nr:SDR family oxidoreductase [Pandoraea sp. ISTKB]ODP35658.1 short-chain dehydrogenase [Pandoraea sp. ISTKB]
MSLLTESSDPIRLDGKVALVTGASRGIGRAIAIALAARGATLGVHYNAASADAETLVAQLIAGGARAFAVQADLASADGAQQLVERFIGALTAHDLPPQFDILVNNAGVGLRARIDAVTPEDFDRVLQVNLKSPFFLIQHALRHVKDGGRIVNVSSMGTRAAYPEMSVYAPAKAGLEALTLSLAADLGARGITVNAVLPGATATDLNKRASDPVARQVIAQTVALGRVGEPRDIADIVAFLASDASRWITGQSIDASGGQRL